MPQGLSAHCTEGLGASVYALGGIINGRTQRETLRIDLLEQTLKPSVPMLEGRMSAASAVIGSVIYVCGGWRRDVKELVTCEKRSHSKAPSHLGEDPTTQSGEM